MSASTRHSDLFQICTHGDVLRQLNDDYFTKGDKHYHPVWQIELCRHCELLLSHITMPLHHSGHVSAIKSPAIKLKRSAVDQRGCQIYVWLSFCQAQAGNIWTEMLSVMWQSFTTGCTLSAQDNSGSEIWSRWRTTEYFTVDLVFNFQPSSLKSVQSTKPLFSQTTTKLFVEKTWWGEIVTEWQVSRAVNVYYVLSWPSEEVLSFLHNFLWSDCKWMAIRTLLNLRRPLLWNVFHSRTSGNLLWRAHTDCIWSHLKSAD